MIVPRGCNGPMDGPDSPRQCGGFFVGAGWRAGYQ
ncbi:hypothetical protein CURE108131_02045 [Cupriavidus respiraculi]|uniref:Uncharacterized protein n=1 Tax=Cupriavidus respiraculi TaxID=195930 RepID=A0ABM8WFG7_9BURK|nr:hypothetical protein LMG21510_00281 [Cupriavidus respiraculi]